MIAPLSFFTNLTLRQDFEAFILDTKLPLISLPLPKLFFNETFVHHSEGDFQVALDFLACGTYLCLPQRRCAANSKGL